MKDPSPREQFRWSDLANPEESRRPTLRDVAALAQVDPSVVSRLVNNDPKLNIAVATRRRIEEAIVTLGYRPNMMARGLRMARTWTIGLIVPALSNPMYTHIVRAAEARAAERGYGIVLGSQVGVRTEETFAGMLLNGRVDGLLVASATLGDAFIQSLVHENAGPVVLVNRRVAGIASSVVVDDTAGSRLVTEHLLKLGHRRIAYLSGPDDIDTSARRRRGFEEAMRDAGVGNPLIIPTGGWNPPAGYRSASHLLSEHPDVTAVFASTMLLGVGALKAFHEDSIAIPDRLSIMCLHDDEILDYTYPPLSTVRMPLEELGGAAVDELISRTEGNAGTNVLIPGAGELVERGSVTEPFDKS